MGIPTGLWALATAFAVATLAVIIAERGRFAEMSPAPRAWRVVEDSICVFLTIGMLGACTLQVVVRYVFSDSVSIAWTEEFLRLLMVWGVLWGAMIVQREDDQIAMTVLYDSLPARARWVVRLAGDLVVLGCLGVVFWYGSENSTNLFGISTTSLGMPVASFALAVPVTAGLMFVFTTATLVRRLRRGPQLADRATG